MQYLTQQIKRKNTANNNYPVYSVTNDAGFKLQAEQFNNEVASISKSNYSIVSKGQYAYNPSRINVGSIGYLKENIDVIISPLYVVFECAEQLDEDFLENFLKTNNFNHQRKALTSVSVRETLSYEGFSEIVIKIPSLEEQQKIGSFFKALDEKIELQKQKVDAIKEYKKGLLQQMFI